MQHQQVCDSQYNDRSKIKVAEYHNLGGKKVCFASRTYLSLHLITRNTPTLKRLIFLVLCKQWLICDSVHNARAKVEGAEFHNLGGQVDVEGVAPIHLGK